MGKNKVLLINTQFVELYVSGFTNRFIGLWCHLQKNGQAEGQVHWVANRSLWKRYLADQRPPKHVTILNANLKYFKFTSRLFYPLYIVYLYYRKKCTSVHIATSIIDSLYLVRLFNLFKIPYCFTFASNSIDMAGYDNERTKKKWQKLFSLAHNIEVLNPTNSIDDFKGKKFVSPTSFPYITELSKIPADLFTKNNRLDQLVFCGTFVAQKNPMLAIHGFVDFFERHSHQYPEATLVMIGRGELMPEVRQEIEKVNNRFCKEIIRLLPDERLIEALSSSKIFLSLQDYDNYPSQSVMEAMLFCNSVISIDNGDTKKLVDEERNNILLNKKHPVELGDAIKKLLDNWILNVRNRELICEKFQPEIFAEYFFKIHSVISGTGYKHLSHQLIS